MDKNCCDWAVKSELERKYHDEQWGVPSYDDRFLFEMLILEGMQAGLSWITILQKRDAMREAFDNFDPYIISNYTEEKIQELMENSSIIRNRLKLRSLPINAQSFIATKDEFGSFSNYLWRYVDNKPIINSWKEAEEVPAKTELSEKISKDLKKRGFKFVGPTIIYSFLQSVGVINDHLIYCHRHSVNL